MALSAPDHHEAASDWAIRAERSHRTLICSDESPTRLVYHLLIAEMIHSIMRVYLLFIFLVSSIFCGQAQSPADGRVEAHAYVNTYLHFTYAWPSILQPQDPGLLHIGPHPNPNENLLFAARQGDEPYGIVVLSEKLNAPWHNFAGFKDGPDFLRRIPIGQAPEDHFKILASKHATTPDGFSVDELDYAVAGEFASGITIRIGDYIVVFKCNAASLDNLDTMIQSVLATRRTE